MKNKICLFLLLLCSLSFGQVRDYLNVIKRSDLRAWVFQHGQLIAVTGISGLNDTPIEVWYYDENSMAVDDGTDNSTAFKPTEVLVTEPGRYLRTMNLSDWNKLLNKPVLSTVSVSGSYNDLTNKPVIPTNNNQLINGSNFITNLSGFTTSSLPEGSNLYWTPTRFNSAFSGKTTSDLPENTNLYFTNTRARSAISINSNTILQYNSSTGVFTQKRIERYSGTTDASGNFTVSFSTAFSATPNIQVCLINPNIRDTPIPTISTSGFTVNVQRRTDIAGLLPTYANVSGATVHVLITEN